MDVPFVFDASDPDFADRAYEIYRGLRDEHPVYHDERRGCWVLSRYDDVRDAAADPVKFSSEGTSISMGLLPMLQQLDPPRHDELRELMWRAFTPRRVAGLEPKIRRIARALIDDIAEAGACDLMQDFASQLPSRVIGELIGIPKERLGAFLEWTEVLIRADPHKEWETNPFPLIYGEFAKLLDERRSEPRDDLMSALIEAEIDGQRLTQEELLGFCFLLVVGGNDTTMNLIANGAVLLARHPEQRAALVRDPSLIPKAVEEVLRYDSPTQALPRIATCALEIHGFTIPTGDEVSLVWGAANHDERRFSDPERFDIQREDNRHLALGHGAHFCMGANLARMEGRIAFEELLARLPDYELVGEPQWQTSRWARAYQSVPIEAAARV
ncbi:MAG: cytochrome P450 [Deltaproteobacteria bacterium]|nr:cytochrome P450 [Deltaproteobacteria bacterium]